MINLHHTLTIQRSPEDVFAYLVDFSTWPQWRSTLSSATPASEGPVKAGSTCAVTGQMMGRTIEMTVEISQYIENKRVGYRTVTGPLNAEGLIDLQPVEGGTRLVLTGSASPGGPFKLAGAIVGRQAQKVWETDLGLLKGLLEA